MKPHWRLTVEGFGRIASADVALRRLTLFVGPFTSGAILTTDVKQDKQLAVFGVPLLDSQRATLRQAASD